MRVQSEFLAAKSLKDNFSEFFYVKGNVHTDFTLYHFNKIIRFKNCTYEVKFSLKETYDMLGDNYLNCKRGLKNLTKKTFLNNLLNEYEKTINEQLN